MLFWRHNGKTTRSQNQHGTGVLASSPRLVGMRLLRLFACDAGIMFVAFHTVDSLAIEAGEYFIAHFCMAPQALFDICCSLINGSYFADFPEIPWKRFARRVATI
jgi:hypothetical protein